MSAEEEDQIHGQTHLVEKPPQPSLLQKMMVGLKSFTISTTYDQPFKGVLTSQNYYEIAAIFEAVSKQPHFADNVKHTLHFFFFRIKDTGGQPELMDMLLALTIVPGLYTCCIFLATSSNWIR